MVLATIMSVLVLGVQGPRVDPGRTVEKLAQLVESNYSYPEVGKQLAKSIRQAVQEGAYDGVDGPGLASQLTKQLQEISRDKHLFVQFSSNVLPPEPDKPTEPSEDDLQQQRASLASQNFGLHKVEILPGNIGYLDFRLFAPIVFAADTYHGAMATVANSDALIVDLRRNSGSMDPETIPTLMGYFFARPVHLSDLKWRWEETPRQYWSAAQVPGRKYLDKPIYVLTSQSTFSGGEAFAYELQAYKRATVVGDRTGGGANPNVFRRVDDHFAASIPSGVTRNAVTGTNWEGKGVVPDIKVPVMEALKRAHLEALKFLADHADGPRKQGLRSELRRVEQTPLSIRRIKFVLKGFQDAKKVMVAGTFNGWNTGVTSLARVGSGWEIETTIEPGRHAYKFIVDDVWMSDPANPEREPGEGDTDSVLIVP